MLKKSLKPKSNSLNCIEMMLTGAKKRRAMALSAIQALNNGLNNNSKVVMFR